MSVPLCVFYIHMYMYVLFKKFSKSVGVCVAGERSLARGFSAGERNKRVKIWGRR